MKAIRQIGSLAFVLGLFVSIFAGMPWYMLVSDDPVVPWWLKIAVFCLLGGILVVLASLAFEQRAARPVTDQPKPVGADDSVLLLNADRVPGREVYEILGLVCVHAAGIVLSPCVQDVFLLEIIII